MINNPPIRAFSRIRAEAIPDVTKTWKIGQLLNATAESNVNANNKLLMRIGQLILETKTPIPIKAGDSLKLLVKSLGETPVLKILTPTAQPRMAAQNITVQNIAAQNLKSFIALQQDLTGLLQLGQKILENPYLPKILKQQFIDFNQKLPAPEQATLAKSLREMIQNSGVFLESKLKYLQQNGSQYDTPTKNALWQDILNRDVKSQLLKINAQLQSMVPELTAKPQLMTSTNPQSIIDPLLKQFIKGDINLVQLSALLTNNISKGHIQIIQQVLSTADRSLLPKELLNSFALLLNHIQLQGKPLQVQENLSGLLKTMELLQELKTSINGALAKITSQQLITLTRDPDSLLLLIFDLYFKDKTENHLIKFRLEQEKSAKEQNDSGWQVTLNFNFEELGPIQVRLHLIDDHISTVFYAEKKNTAQSISQQINLLESAFRNIGFDAINLDVTHGSISQPRDLPKNVHLLDEKA